jgi:hypothetical protein
MSYIKSISGLFAFVVFICCSCKQKVEEKADAITPASKDSLSGQSHDSLPSVAVYSSSDFGLSWQPMVTGLPNNLQPTAIEKIGHELILATANEGLFMTENNRTSWKNIGSGLATKKINTLYINGDEVYIGLFHEGVTMWKLKSSYWNSYNNNLPNRNVLAIVKVKNELVIGTDMGIFKSSGHIQTWMGKHIGEQAVSLQTKGDTIYAGTVKGVLMSKDGGENWMYVHKGGAIHAIKIVDNLIYAFYTSGDVVFSNNWGSRWEQINYTPREQSYIQNMIQVDDNFLMSNKYGVLRSKNGGMAWKLIYPESKNLMVGFAVEDHVVYGAARSNEK